MLIVYGHIIPGFIPEFTKYVSTFHIPLFFFISGVLFNVEKYSNRFIFFLKNRVNGLLLPYFYMSLLVLIGYYFIQDNYLQFIGSWIVKGWVGYALWFVPVLLFVEFISFPFLLLGKIARILVILIFALCSFISSKYWGFLSYNLLLVFCGSYYYIIGNISRKILLEKREIRRNKNLIIGLLLGFILSLFYLPLNTDIPEYFINKIPHLIFYISPLGAIMMLVSISIFIDKFNKTNIIVRFLANCGKNSFIILAFHQIICLVIQKFLSSKITISLLIIILAFLVYLIPQYMPWLIGKKNESN